MKHKTLPNISKYKIPILQFHAYGKWITLSDQKKIKKALGFNFLRLSETKRKVLFLFNRSLKEYKDKLSTLTLSKLMKVYEITEKQYCCDSKESIEHLVGVNDVAFDIIKPTKYQQEKGIVIG